MTGHRKERKTASQTPAILLAPTLEPLRLMQAARFLRNAPSVTGEVCIMCVFTAFDGLVTNLLWMLDRENIASYFESTTVQKFSSLFAFIQACDPDPSLLADLELCNAIRNEIVHPFPYAKRLSGVPRSGLQRLIELGVWQDYPDGPEHIAFGRFGATELVDWCWDVCLRALLKMLDGREDFKTTQWPLPLRELDLAVVFARPRQKGNLL